MKNNNFINCSALSKKELENRIEPRKVLLCSPKYFQVIDAKNVHMGSNIGKTNPTKAYQQWESLKAAYLKLKSRGLIDEIIEIDPIEGCEDMVFTANQSFPWQNTHGGKIVVLSKMYHSSRAREVPYFETLYKNLGYSTTSLKNAQYFEGMGDTIPHPHKRLLYGGYGHRTTLDAYHELSDLLETPILTLELKEEKFYHLDTCFLPINQDHLFICKEAFSNESIEHLSNFFKEITIIPIEEASQFFALNAHVVPSTNEEKSVAIIQEGANDTIQLLNKNNIEVIKLNTSEYIQSGGSVFCMKMMLY
ncbi:MAG: hypothetical protein EAZ07_05015 [Cytophagales bacterium]|nr:MAG: hypothetical protein EAZ07_05015 [Cytophagales bacterium]